jgi:hypothetical protein
MKEISLIVVSAFLLFGCGTSVNTASNANQECEIVGNREPPLLLCGPQRQPPQAP